MTFSFFLKDKNLEKSLIYLVCRSNDKRVKISTGMFVHSKSWSTENARVKKNHAGQELNARLDKIESAAKEFFNRARLVGISEPTELFAYVKNRIIETGILDRRNTDTASIKAALDEFIKQIENGTRPTKRKISATVSDSYLQLFKVLKSILSDMLPKDSSLPYFQTKEFAVKFNGYRSEHWSDNTAGKYIRLLRRFLLWARDSHLYTFEEFPQCLSLPEEHETTMFALTDIELRVIENLDLSDRPSLDRVRDLFLISCYTGLRFSDLSRLSKEHIGTTEIRISAKKTDDNIRCPITPRLRKILDRYSPNYEFKHITGQRANEHLKEIAEQAGICDMLEVITYKNGRKVTEVRPKNELIAWHCSRRTFITLSLILGVQPAAVMAVSGHKKDSISFNKYVLYSKSQIDNELNSAWE